MYYRRLGQICLSLLSLLTLFLLAPARPVYAESSQGDEVVVGDDLTLHAGEHIDGDVVILGGSLTMEADSRVEGSITAFGGRLEIDGTVQGDLVAFGANVDLGAHARITGEVVALGGQLYRAEGSQTGDVVKGLSIDDIESWRRLRLPSLPVRLVPRSWSAIGITLITIVGALIVALLGVVIVSLWPDQTARVGETVLTAPLPSLGVGCLLYPLAGSLTVFVLLTLCLAPFAPVVVLLLVTASLFGWVALGTLLGRWLVRTSSWRQATPLLAAGSGVFVLSVVAAVAGVIPVLGILLIFGAASIGLGAVVLSRFGTSRYRRRPSAEPPAEA